MRNDRALYEFAARAGALEGYVYGKEKLAPDSLKNWVNSVVEQHHALPPEVRAEVQDLCDGTIGRAIRSLTLLLEEDHSLIEQLKTLVKGDLPSSPDDFFRS